MNKDKTIDIIFLQTDLFGDAGDILTAVETVDNICTEVVNLQPEQMGDTEWDDVMHRILRAKKVITL